MKYPLSIYFEYDYDSNLYMLSKDADAGLWKVIVHCGDGKKYFPSIDKFVAYPGCAAHKSEAAWFVEYYKPEIIEIQRFDEKPLIVKHPDKSE
jgi:hypothetical protein